MDEKLLTTYSLFSALANGKTDIYNAVFVPICKRALSLYAQRGHTAGTDQDIKEIMLEEYGINAPTLIVRELIGAAQRDLSRKNRSRFNFRVFNDRGSVSFQFDEYSFSEINDEYADQRRKANALQEAFEKFIEADGGMADNIQPFSEFISKNQIRVSSFLSGKGGSFADSDETSFMPHVRFLKHIEQTNSELYKTTKQIFIGSIIAAYLEASVDLNAKLGKGVTYYLDTQIVLELLDLQREEETLPIKELVDLIRETGGIVKVMDITLEETMAIIDFAVKRYSDDYPKTTINEACKRRGETRAWLMILRDSLEDTLSIKYGVAVDKVSETDREKFSNTEDAQKLSEIWHWRNTAVHDVSAYLFVREKRKRDPNKRLIQKASCWFVSANERLGDFNSSKRATGLLPEIVTPLGLTSVLFIQNPSKLSERVQNVGLNAMIAQTLTEEYPSRELLNELDDAILKSENVSSEEYEILVSAVARESSNSVFKLIDDAGKDPDKFNRDIHALIENERNKKNDAEKSYMEKVRENKDLQTDNEELRKQLSEISSQFEELNKREEQRRLEEKKRRKKINVFVIVLILCVVLFSVPLIFPKIVDWLKNIFSWISSIGGIVSFVEIIINKKLKPRQSS